MSSEPLESAGTFDTAIDDVVRLVRELTSAIAKLAYADAACARGELEHALSRAQRAAETLPEPLERTEAEHHLQEIRAVADLMLTIAPAPSSAAIEAAEAGDETAWTREEQAWIVSRLARDVRPRGPQRRGPRRDTRPGTPTALREESRDAGGADAPPPGTALAPSPSPDPPPHKAGAR